MASNSERREFEKYLKFLVNKVIELDPLLIERATISRLRNLKAYI